MPKRIQIVARIDPALRKVVARVMRRDKTTLNALVETALRAHVEGLEPERPAKAIPKEPQ
jgi:hypothetical protein